MEASVPGGRHLNFLDVRRRTALDARYSVALIRERSDQPLFIIDIAVPRDVAPEVNEMDGVFLYDMDSLQSIAQQSLALRRQQIAAGEGIIAEHVADFRAWFGRTGDERAPVAPEIAGGLDETALRTSEL